MTIDLQDKEVLKALKEAGYVSANDVEGLKNKNAELLGKLKDGKATTEELEKLQSQLKEIEDAKLKDSENWTELETRLRTEMGELKGNLESQNGALTTALVERDLMSELVKAKVAPQFIEAAKAMHGSKVEYTDGKTLVDGKPLGEFIGEWAQSDEGKHFVAAPDNNGGGAPGGGGNANGKTITREQLEKMAPQEQSDFFLKEGGQVVE